MKALRESGSTIVQLYSDLFAGFRTMYNLAVFLVFTVLRVCMLCLEVCEGAVCHKCDEVCDSHTLTILTLQRGVTGGARIAKAPYVVE
jgi:hypothetical protein